MLDTTGYDIGPLVQSVAAEYGIPAVGLLALLKAESNLNPHAARQGIFPDWSYGLGQLTVGLAESYGIGDGTQASWPALVAALQDRHRAIALAADYYRFSLHGAEGSDPSLEGDAWLLTVVLDGRTGTSELQILAADDVAAGPVARARLPHVMPLGFHGSWQPAV